MYCECGCGGRIKKIEKTDRGRGHVKGEYLRFLKGHNLYTMDRFGENNPCYGRDFKGDKCPAWKGGRIKKMGYVFIHSPNHPVKNNMGYVQEHRLIVEHHIGRYLTKEEVVHHVNGIKEENRVKNLMAFICNSEHIRFENGSFVNKQSIIFDGREL